MPRSSLRRTVAAVTSGVLIASGTTGCFADPSAMPAVRDFLIAWQVGNYEAASGHTTGGSRAAVTDALGQINDQLDAVSLKLGLSRIVKRGERADARFTVKVDLGESGEPWQYTGVLRLKRVDGTWKIIWDPSIVHPELKAGQRLAVETEAPARGAVHDQAGRSMLRTASADVVGVHPGKLADAKKTIDQLAAMTKLDGDRRLDADRLLARVLSAPPEDFLPLVTLQRPEYAALSARLRNVPGLEVRTEKPPIAPAMAPELVGGLGPATADRLQQVGAPYQPGDTIGVNGIQLLYQRRLAGIPAVRVVAQDPNGQRRVVLAEWRGQDSNMVRTTLVRKEQLRAEAALKDLQAPASMVAVRAGTGEVLAVANHRSGGRNLALERAYPPGLTFGIVSAEALLTRGLRQNTPTECPASTQVGGQTFTNPGGGTRPKSTLQMHFAYSCLTTMAMLSKSVDAGTLISEAQRFGIGKDFGLTVPTAAGSLQTPKNDAEKAALMIGQRGVTASPLTMALVSGAATSSVWRPPLLLSDPVEPSTVNPQTLEPAPAVGDLRTLMQRSVFEGTAKAANVGGGKIYGVVSTVKYREGDHDKTVSWFVGARNDVAFAIAVEGDVPAAQIAARFLRPDSVR